MTEGSVAVFRRAGASYPTQAPFHPGEPYPEAPFGHVASGPNAAYDAVRQVFRLAGLDAARYGTPQWNPLGGIVRPGQCVLLKPNLVKESHPRDTDGWQYVLTHGSVIRAVADYAWKALEGRGTVVVADSPQTDSSFVKTCDVLGLNAVTQYYTEQGLDFRLLDLRREQWQSRNDVVVSRAALPGDPFGYVEYDLKDASEFVNHGGAGRYYGADYDSQEVNRHHTGGRHEYLLSGCAIAADVVISMPKLKTHKKAGVTSALKNLVGVTGDKNYLPHHTEGPADRGGDERPLSSVGTSVERGGAALLRRMSLGVPVIGTALHRLARLAGKRIFGDTEEVVRSGNWWGNDTVWRMCLDLNKLVCYGAPDGSMRPEGPAGRKPHLVLVDGIIAGQGRGPLNPDPYPAGVIAFGTNAPSVDAACTVLVGFDPDRVPIIRHAFQCRRYPLVEWPWTDVRIVSNEDTWATTLEKIPVEATMRFAPHFSWAGHIERRARE
jgi:uncharacterized protein (DUF362 family)